MLSSAFAIHRDAHRRPLVPALESHVKFCGVSTGHAHQSHSRADALLRSSRVPETGHRLCKPITCAFFLSCLTSAWYRPAKVGLVETVLRKSSSTSQGLVQPTLRPFPCTCSGSAYLSRTGLRSISIKGPWLQGIIMSSSVLTACFCYIHRSMIHLELCGRPFLESFTFNANRLG